MISQLDAILDQSTPSDNKALCRSRSRDADDAVVVVGGREDGSLVVMVHDVLVVVVDDPTPS